MSTRRAVRVSSLFVALVALSGCGEPLFVLPGGALSGTVMPAPTNWNFSNAFETVQLETRPDDPYSVNVWGMGSQRTFFVASGDGMESAWAQHIAADPNVRLRLGDEVYELRAVRADGKLDRRRFRAMGEHKYDDFDSAFEDLDAVVVFRLERR